MAKILYIDTANQFCSVALSNNEKLIGLRETNEKNAHARVITIFIDEVLKENSLTPADIDAIAVSMGPGSYTGLRIGISAAKGLCYALNKPMIAISTLQLMAYGTIQNYRLSNVIEPGTMFCPMIDARRMEVYASIYNENCIEIREVIAEVIDEKAFQTELKNGKVIFSGDGAAKCKEFIGKNPNAIFIDDFQPSAKYMIPLALAKYKNEIFEDVAYFEPFYLKEFKAGLPRVKGLN